MKKKRSRIHAALAVTLALTLFPLPAAANSAQTQWSGTDAAGAIVTEESCPLVVEHEQLRFALSEFPESAYQTAAEFLAYSGSVTAEYTFYNPADYTVTATLVFPFGAAPDYGAIYDPDTDTRCYDMDTEKHLVTVNGTAVPRTLRHTLLTGSETFDRKADLAKLHDGFQLDPFYEPMLTVTRCIYQPSGIDTAAYPAATAAFEYRGDASRVRLLAENSCGGRLLDDGIQLDFRADQNEGLVLDVIGEPPEEPQWKFYENGSCEKEIDGSMTLVSTETMTLADLALSRYDARSGILDYDWYNAFITLLNRSEWEYGVIPGSEVPFDLTGQLMRWYEYDITLAPGEHIVNAVTAPMYPAIDGDYAPPVYAYTYLLSPAQSWASFGDLDIAIETPFYLTESSLSGFEKTDAGYALHREGLPSGELTFTLCAEEDAQPQRSGSGMTQVLFVFVGLGTLLAAILLWERRSRKKH